MSMRSRGVAGLVLVVAVGLGLSSCGTIGSGNVGVRTTLGKINPEELEPGVYLGVPAISQVAEFSGKEIGVDLSDLTPKARDNLSLRDLDVTLYYRVATGQIADLTVKYAGQHVRDEGSRVTLPAHGLLSRLARNAIYEQAARIDSLVMHTQRDELASAVRRGLQAELDANDKGVFTITRVVIRALTTDPAIERTIQESVAAQKQLETTKQRVAIAEAEAQVEIKRAEGVARANQIINQSLTREYLQHESNLALMKFAEKGGATTVVIPANMQTAPLINIGK
ncbi:SPFH domain-containing protein [Aquabacterium sp. OR-4]|uniref:SPFH domain-containing protein n=1 Tax=Aquabacterium sp. OR-4 TaxID=2978127 RepID=UPI0028C7C1F1|nr:SPFH domain-containing protein [Aquabacterium sp. OR-4]MDT7839020.1 SPFH domain-containing protein [Aquabacterium sp. OR-4]